MDMQVMKCPDCGANIEYDGSTPYVHCQYCGTEIAIGNPTPQTVHVVDDAEMKRLEMRQERHLEREQRHAERLQRHEQRHEERREERLERHARRLI